MTRTEDLRSLERTGEEQRGSWFGLAALCLGFFMLLVDGTIIAVAIPEIISDLGVSEKDAIWANSSYLFAYAVPLLLAGRLGDRFGPKPVYLWGLAVFMLASLACGMAANLPVLVAARVVQGLGAAIMTPQSLTVITRTLRPPRLAVALGIWGAVAGIASISGPLLGGVLISLGGWKTIFLVNLPLGLLAFLAALRWVPRLAPQRVSIPLLSTLVSGAGILAIVIGVHEGPVSENAMIAGVIPAFVLVIAGLLALVASVVCQPREPDRVLVPKQLFRRRNFVLGTAGASIASFVVGASLIPVMLYLQGVARLNALDAAIVLIPMGLVSAVLAPVVGNLVNRAGAKWIAIVGTLALSISLALMSIGADHGWPPLAFSGALALYGLANSFLWSPLSVAAMSGMPNSMAGAASGVYNAIRQIGAVLGSATVAALLAVTTVATALLVLAVFALLGLFCAFGLRRAED